MSHYVNKIFIAKSITRSYGIFRKIPQPPKGGGGVSADVIWGENMKKEEKKMENVEEN
jgi:hypothetical protein